MFVSNQAFNESPDGNRMEFTVSTPLVEVLVVTQAGRIFSCDAYKIDDPETISFTDPPIPENGELRIIGFAITRNASVSNQIPNETVDGSRTEFTLPTPIAEFFGITQAGVLISPNAYEIGSQETITFTDPPIPENGELRIIGFCWETLAVEQVDVLFATQKDCLFDCLSAIGGATFAHALMDPEAEITPDADSILFETLTLEAAYIAAKSAWVQIQQNIDDLDEQVDAFVMVEKDDFINMSSVLYQALWEASTAV